MLPSPELVLAAVLPAAPVAARFPGALVSQLEEAVQAHLLVLVQVLGPISEFGFGIETMVRF